MKHEEKGEDELIKVPTAHYFERDPMFDYVLILNGSKMKCYRYPEEPTLITHKQLVNIHKQEPHKPKSGQFQRINNAEEYCLDHEGIIYMFTNNGYCREFEETWDYDIKSPDAVNEVEVEIKIETVSINDMLVRIIEPRELKDIVLTTQYLKPAAIAYYNKVNAKLECLTKEQEALALNYGIDAIL